MTMKLHLTIQIWRKKHWFLAKCPELDFVSQGRTREEAQKNLLEVIEIQFEEMSRMGTLDEYLEECGYDLKIFETHGCTYVRKKGSHHILTCPEGKRAVVIPEYDEVDVDIIKNNMRTAGMSRNQYFALLEKI